MRKILLALVALAAGWSVPAEAQVSANLPVTCSTTTPGQCVRATPVTNPDGTNIGVSGGGATPTGTAGSPNAAVVTVQGITGGTAQNVQGTGTAGSSATGVVTVQGIAGGTAQNVTVATALPAGSAIIGNVRIDQTTPGTTNGVAMIPNTAAALGIAPTTVASVNSQVAKASAGNFYGLNVENAAVTGTYALLYNATAAPTAGASLTTSSILWHILLGSGQSMDKAFPVPVRCSTGCVVLYSTSLTTFTAPATAPALSTVLVL